MKTTASVLLTTLLLGGLAHAQYTTPQQRARNVSGRMTEQQNTAAQTDVYSRYGIRPPAPGVPPGEPPAAPPATPVPTAPPIKPSAQQVAATKLKADIGEARGKGEVTAEMKKQFVHDLEAVAQGRIRPSSGSVTRFGESLLTAIAGKTATASEDAKLVKAIVISFNSAGLPAARVQEINAEVRGVLTKSGVASADASVVGENLSAVVSDIESVTPN